MLDEGSIHSPSDAPRDLEPRARRQWVVFGLADERFALPVLNVREVLSEFAIERAPNAQDFVLGLINLRGEIVTVLDGHARLDSPRAVPEPGEPRVVILEAGTDVIGLRVDTVSEVISLEDAEIGPAPAVGDSERAHYISGVVARGAGLIFLLDSMALCHDPAALEDAAVR
jgi:purine-binding chemotaxis protein CheW